jgi:hypothetical protein
MAINFKHFRLFFLKKIILSQKFENFSLNSLLKHSQMALIGEPKNVFLLFTYFTGTHSVFQLSIFKLPLK